MNWARLRHAPWLDTRAGFVAGTPRGGSLLDLGSSDGETLGHFAELRPDLKFFAADLAGQPERYPAGCEFHRANLETESLPWPDGSLDAITCMHLVEHLQTLDRLLGEVARLLRPGGRAYFETPHPRSLTVPGQSADAPIQFTLNFNDDPTHVRLVPMEKLALQLRALGLRPGQQGISRNWLFAAAWPWYRFQPASRKKFTAQVHWLGWSAFLIVRRPAQNRNAPQIR